MPKPVLLFGYGNLSRGDDALGPLLLEYVEQQFDLTEIDLLTDFQLQIEHALDLDNRELVLFIDATVTCVHGFDFIELEPARDAGYSTHAMSPAAVLSVYQSIQQRMPPPCFLLGIKGDSFELGEGLTANAEKNLAHACQYVGQLLNTPCPDAWRDMANSRLVVNLELISPWPEDKPLDKLFTQGCQF